MIGVDLKSFGWLVGKNIEILRGKKMKVNKEELKKLIIECLAECSITPKEEIKDNKEIYVEYSTVGGNIRIDFPTANDLVTWCNRDMEHSVTEIKCVNRNNDEVFSCKYMFYNNKYLRTIDLSEFDTSNVTNMAYMFNGCRRLSKIDLSNFDTLEVNFMNYMFQNCQSLTSLDLSHFDTRNVLDMDAMFRCCYELKELNISSFDMQNVRCINSMFDETHFNLFEKMEELYGSKK